MELAQLTDKISITEACAACSLRECSLRDSTRFPVVRQHRILARGERLDCDDAGGCMRFWIVVRGTAGSCTTFSDGRRQIIGLERAGDIICAPMTGNGSQSWLEALSDCEICILDLTRHAESLRDDPDFLAATFHVTHRRLARSQAHLSTLGRLDSQERVTLFLAEMAARESQPVVTLHMSREDIADYLGLNAETVSRILSRLKKSGLVKFLSHTEYVVPDMAALERRLPVPVTVADERGNL